MMAMEYDALKSPYPRQSGLNYSSSQFMVLLDLLPFWFIRIESSQSTNPVVNHQQH